MPKERWTGYKRFCPLAKGLDLVGERWTLVIVQELLSGAKRYSDLQRRLPGIGTSVLSDRLRKLEAWGIVERRIGGAGRPVAYALTASGEALGPALQAFRTWGVDHLVDGVPEQPPYDVSFVEGIDALPPESYELHVDGDVSTLMFRDAELAQSPGPATHPAVVVRTTRGFMKRWAAGEIDWDGGRREGSVIVEGDDDAWRRMLAATGYLLRYEEEIEA